MKIFLVAFFFISLLNAKDGMKNLLVHTLDSDEVIKKVDERLEKVKLSEIVNSKYEVHANNIKKIEDDIQKVIKLKQELRNAQINFKKSTEIYENFQSNYQNNIERIYKSSQNIKRESYYLVAHKIDQEYKGDLQNYLLDKYAITKFEQSMVTLDSSDGNSSFKNVITTKKDFGEMQIEILKDFVFRDKNLNFKFLKVTQKPFVLNTNETHNKTIQKEIDKFAQESGVHIEQLLEESLSEQELLNSYDINSSETTGILSFIDNTINRKKVLKKFNLNSEKVLQTLEKIEKKHDSQLVELNKHAQNVSLYQNLVYNKSEALKRLFEETQKLALEYNLTLKLETLEKLIIIAPAKYSEYVELGEEREYFVRKVKSYLSKISINAIKQSESLTNYSDIKTQNSDIQKIIEYESVHLFPFINAKELGLFMFATIEIQDKVTKDNYITKDFEYGKLEFVPIKKAYKTIFASTTEITLGIVKEFLQTNKQNKYFDEYCLQDSLIPQEAQDIKNISQEYYAYPAVCFKVEKLDEFIAWVSKKVQKELVIPNSDDWSYVASNADSSAYCWGNKSLKELNEDEEKPENIYYEDDAETTIERVKEHTPSLLGLYDMCGNVHELVTDGEVYMIKGNSYISYIEKSNAPAMDYGDDLSPSLGLRLFYIRENR